MLDCVEYFKCALFSEIFGIFFFVENLILVKGVFENFLGFWYSSFFLEIYLLGVFIYRWKDVCVRLFIIVMFIIGLERVWIFIIG